MAVLVTTGEVERLNTAALVWTKGKEGRQHAVEAQAWRRVPTRAPELLGLLLRQGLPVIAPDVPNPRGRPRASTFPVVYQAVARCLNRQNLNANMGAMLRPDHLVNNPKGPVSPATVCRFLAGRLAVEPEPVLEKLLALSTWPARPYESLLHPDGTGLTEQHFSAYFDERYDKARRRARREGAEREGARRHHWTFAEILWTYRYTMVAALYAQQGPFGEAPWLLPLLDRARLMLDVREVGGDKAYDANYIFAYARRHGIDAQVKIRTQKTSNLDLKHRRRHAEAAALDPKGFAAKANRRNNAETGNHALKAILGDQIFSKEARSQRNEILCMAIAYNLTRLVFLETERGVAVDFADGAARLATVQWEPLEILHRRHREALPRSLRKHDKPRPEWERTADPPSRA